MGKRFFHFMLAISLFSSAVACSEKEQLGGGKDSLYPVTFTIQTEGRLATRAISDGTGSNVLYYRVLDTDTGNWVSSSLIKDDSNGLARELTNRSSGHTITLNLPKGRNYKIVFWAQNSSCEAYTISDDMKVTVNYAGINNDETRDAFFGSKEFSVGSAEQNFVVVLKRPFAQLNVGSTTADWNDAVASSLTVTKSSLTIKNVATSLNVVDGTVSGSADVSYTYTESNRPEEWLMVDMDKDGTKEQYYWLSMSYLLPNDSGEGADGTKCTTVTTSFTFSDGSTTNTSVLGPIDYIPLQRNWRTNIIGQVLTGETNITVVIDKEYEDDHNILLWDGVTLPAKIEDDGSNTAFISSAEDYAGWASYTRYYAFTGQKLEYNTKLNADLNLVDFNGHDAGSIWLGSEYDHVFDGNGHTLYCGATTPFAIMSRTSSAARNITIKNVTLKNSELQDENFSSIDLVDADNGISGYTDNSIGGAFRYLFSWITGHETTITFENVHFVNTKLTSNSTAQYTHIGGVGGYISSTCTLFPVTLIFKNCTMEDCEMTVNCTDEAKREYYIGGIMGSGYTIENLKTTLSFEGTNTVKDMDITINYYNSNEGNIYRNNIVNVNPGENVAGRDSRYVAPTITGSENLTFTACNWIMNNLDTGETKTTSFADFTGE